MLTHFISWQELQLVSYDKTYLEQNKSRLMHSSFFSARSPLHHLYHCCNYDYHQNLSHKVVITLQFCTMIYNDLIIVLCILKSLNKHF